MPREYIGQNPTAYQRRPHLTKDEGWIREFFKTAQVGHVATAVDGQPFILPTSFWYDEANHQIAFHSNIAGRIRSNIEHNPKVAFEASEMGKLLPSNVALEFSLQYRSAVAFGIARIVEESGEAQRLLYGLIGKYFPELKPGEEYREITDKELRATSVYAIKIEEWSGKENWDEAAEQSDEWKPLDEKWFEHYRKNS
ncbi:MAG: pyridoxamine 5'-phosphate oxidase family protein [Chloroflexi bacterium]|nr:pyridoxamine 5'-phosphate oxidase family protein [Chloroflexi bacterium CFX1]MCK6568566.1 pyridoxamine 5'-phosphate oxidase family protein [Anaerolineales bacterium]MDL1920700.1 pyridoxamine 5'-phosphate oxidase family protein [Chloroflexi bacterium CFX5]NUQ60075.1 pyridoxamine 5'-phosphate oxidase family protein [Anaerolineales bacterium]RIK54119.1 MAG: pyridoxamine 5'-phosphate oxidase family protein [Chloroflexota bacterium]